MMEIPAREMAMTELKGRIARSFEQMYNTTTLDETTLKNCMKKIKGALLDADFPERVVLQIEEKIQEAIKTAAASEKGWLIYKTLLDEISRTLDPRKSAIIEAKRGRTIVMFVGLRGVGKSDTCAKYARHHLKKGFRPALVCADLSSVDSLKKSAGGEVPLYCGSFTRDAAKVARQGIAKFMNEKRDFILVDTSNRHEEYSALFAEMRQLAQAVFAKKPDLVIFVIDGRMGRAAFAHALGFKRSFPVGVVIVTNINDNSKALATLGAVAETECPIILAETGDKGDEFEPFEARPFVWRLLRNPLCQRVNNNNLKFRYTLREMYNRYKKESLLSRREPMRKRINLHLTIMDSMTDEELDKSRISSKKRALEIASKSNVEFKDVAELIKTYLSKCHAWKPFESGRVFS